MSKIILETNCCKEFIYFFTNFPLCKAKILLVSMEVKILKKQDVLENLEMISKT